MQLPREILIGWEVLDRAEEIFRRLRLKPSALVLTGPHVYNIVGKKVILSLESLEYKTDSLIVKESTNRQVNEILKVVKDHKPGFLLGVGGGKVIDVAKLIAYHINRPFISVPTAASHDGISSDRVSISDSKNSYSIQTHAPLGIIIDTKIVSQSPYRLTASGCSDIVAKYTAVKDWEFGHKYNDEYYGEYASNLALMSANLILKHAKIIRQNTTDIGLRIVLEALLSCGVAMSIAGSSRPCSGSEHLFSHALDMVSPNVALHGEKCGVGTIMMACLQKRNWQRIRNKLKIIGSPVTAKELGVKTDHIIDALTMAHKIRVKRYTVLGKEGLSRTTAEKLAKKTGVIN